ncbi:MAG: hypothetical protein PHV49_01360 [Alistipes sp.]|nr:hypothetical protein [Alistipes sp.]
MKATAIFRIEVQCDNPACEEMNLHLNLTSFNAIGTQLHSDYLDISPCKVATRHALSTTESVAEISASIYMVPIGTPQIDNVSDAPDFTLRGRILRDNTLIDTFTLTINRWGGAQRINMRYKSSIL